MPKQYRSKKKARRTYRKRTYRNSRKRTQNPKTTPMGLRLVHKAKLRYVEQASIDATIGTRAAHFYSMNNMYDPNLTGGGHQPLGYDQLALLYTHYNVKSAKITVRFANTTAHDGMWVGLTLTRDTAALAVSDTQLYENSWTKKRLINTQNKPVTLSWVINIKKWLGIKQSSDPDSLRAAFPTTTGPTEQVFCVIWAQALSSSPDPPAILFNVQMEYFSHFTEPLQLAQS